MTLSLPCTRCSTLVRFEAIPNNKAYCESCKAYRSEREYFADLADRVHGSPGGFQALGEDEKVFFAVTGVIGLAYPFGFANYFAEPSGSTYPYALRGLRQIDAMEAAGQLARAKRLLFGDGAVPVDQAERIKKMNRAAAAPALAALQKEFAPTQEDVVSRCRAVGIGKRLFGQ